jgi:hypothetical protein
MTDKITVHPQKHVALGSFSTKLAFAALLSTSVISQSANAQQQEWWFDVEVIIFERNLDTANLAEKFKQSRLEPSSSNYIDLLTPYMTPDLTYIRAGLSYCRASNRLAAKKQYEQGFAFSLPVSDTNESSSSQPKDRLKQDPSFAVNPDKVSEENFQYEVATTDIFAQPDNAEHATPKASEQGNSGNKAQQQNLELTAKLNVTRPPIQIELIEWQVPSEFPCVYAEQIDPSFASISTVQNTVSGALPSDYIKHVPEIINGTLWQQKRSAFLLPRSTMYMDDLYDKIQKQRDITPILHLNWRQEVKFGRENGQTIRLFAGENFADQFDSNGLPVVNGTDSLFNSLNQPTDDLYIPAQELALLTPEQQQALLLQINGEESVAEDLFAKIDAALADNSPINFEQVDSQTDEQKTNKHSKTLQELWQLDGGITVYLRNVGRVPYLHIDSNLDFRHPVFAPEKAQNTETLSTNLSEQGVIVGNQLQQPDSLQPNYLQSVNFNQLRRVISKQMHYFDHPLFGMVVRITRYHWPEVEESETLPR